MTYSNLIVAPSRDQLISHNTGFNDASDELKPVLHNPIHHESE